MSIVGIVVGSDSDLPKIKDCFVLLDRFNVPFEISIISAHRSPDLAHQWAKTAIKRGIKIIIAAAGGAAHLPGVIASHTILPVIGIPIETNIGGGLDSILSMLQMPSGIPVATMSAGKAGGTNAALFAIQMLSSGSHEYDSKLLEYKIEILKSIELKNTSLKANGYKQYIKIIEESK